MKITFFENDTTREWRTRTGPVRGGEKFILRRPKGNRRQRAADHCRRSAKTRRWGFQKRNLHSACLKKHTNLRRFHHFTRDRGTGVVVHSLLHGGPNGRSCVRMRKRNVYPGKQSTHPTPGISSSSPIHNSGGAGRSTVGVAEADQRQRTARSRRSRRTGQQQHWRRRRGLRNNCWQAKTGSKASDHRVPQDPEGCEGEGAAHSHGNGQVSEGGNRSKARSSQTRLLPTRTHARPHSAQALENHAEKFSRLLILDTHTTGC